MKGKQTNAKQIEEIVLNIATKLADEQGVDIWDVKYEKIGGNWFLTIILDKPDGIGIDDCEKFSRAISDILDEKDPIPDSYCLEVSSPGMNREIKKPKHFDAVMGQDLKISLYKAFNGEKEFIGKLTDYNKETVTIETDENEIVFERKEISKIALYDDAEYLK